MTVVACWRVVAVLDLATLGCSDPRRRAKTTTSPLILTSEDINTGTGIRVTAAMRPSRRYNITITYIVIVVVVGSLSHSDETEEPTKSGGNVGTVLGGTTDTSRTVS